MKKVILIDGNNILFRSYFATAYKGTILKVFLLMLYMVLLI